MPPLLRMSPLKDRCYAILLDGGFIKYGLRRRGDPPISDKIVDAFIKSVANLPELTEARLHRVYYYDAKPLAGKVTRPDGVEIDFSASKTAEISKSQHATISRLPYVAMRFGELSYRGWKVRESAINRGGDLSSISVGDLKANVQQKGVDMRIGLDIAALTLKRQVDIIVLVTGDSDLIPAMKFARREGAQLVLITLTKSIKDLMYDHADVLVDDIDWVEFPSDAESAS